MCNVLKTRQGVHLLLVDLLIPLFQLHLQDSEACTHFDVILGNRDMVRSHKWKISRNRTIPALAFMERTHLSKEISFIVFVFLAPIPGRFCSTLGGRSGNLPRQLETKKTGKQMNSFFF